jgi:3-oxoadipate enol-lactonase
VGALNALPWAREDRHVGTVLGRLHVRVRGEGSAVLFWPSLFMDGAMWHAQVDALASEHCCVVIDPPGQGHSAPALYPPTPPACADAAVQVLDALRLERAHWVGSSWGGMVAINVAARYPRRAHSIALINTASRAASRTERIEVVLMAPVVRQLGFVAPIRRQVIRGYLGSVGQPRHAALEHLLHEALRRLDRSAATTNAQAVISLREDQTELLADIRCPTLVVGGRADPLFLPPETEALARSIRGAHLQLLDDTAHLAPLEQPARVLAALQEHLSAAW